MVFGTVCGSLSSSLKSSPDLLGSPRSRPPRSLYQLTSSSLTRGRPRVEPTKPPSFPPSHGSVFGISRGLPPSAQRAQARVELPGTRPHPAPFKSCAEHPAPHSLYCWARDVSLSELCPHHDSAAISESGPRRQQPGTPTGLGARDLHLRPSPGAGGGTHQAPQHLPRPPKAHPQGPLPTTGECRPSARRGRQCGGDTTGP